MDKSGELCAYNSKPKRRLDWGIWQVECLCDVFSHIPDNHFPDLTFEDEPLEVEFRPTATYLDEMARKYANSITNNKEIRRILVGAFKARYT